MKDKELVEKLRKCGPIQREHIINKLKVPVKLMPVLGSICVIVDCWDALLIPNQTCVESIRLHKKINNEWIKINQYRHKIWNFDELQY